MEQTIPNPLLAAHQQAEAEFQPYAQVQIVATFGQPQAEYSAVHKACGMMDLPQRGIIELTGKDRLTFLNNLITNQTFDKQTKTQLAAGSGVYAFLLNAKNGRIIVDLTVLELGERTLLELDARFIESVLQTLERYRFAEQVQFVSRIGELHEIALHGPGTKVILEKASDAMPDVGDPIHCGVGRIIGKEVVIWRDDPCGVPGYHLVAPTDSAQAIWDHLLVRFGGSDQLGKRDLRPIGWAAFNACRIEAGRAIFGIDFDNEILPAESGQMKRAVSLTKGCYPGQEIVARMHARQQVAKQLVGLKFDNDALPIAGSPIYDAEQNSVGVITSSTISPILSGAAIGLGFVKRPLFALGSRLLVPAEGEMRRRDGSRNAVCPNLKGKGMIDSPYLVEPGKKLKLDKLDTSDKGDFKDRDEAEPLVEKNLKKLASLQEVLYAESKRSLLVVFQAMDAGGKDGAISHIFSGVNPQGCSVTSFKSPSTLERAHDFLWRVHQRSAGPRDDRNLQSLALRGRADRARAQPCPQGRLEQALRSHQQLREDADR